MLELKSFLFFYFLLVCSFQIGHCKVQDSFQMKFPESKLSFTHFHYSSSSHTHLLGAYI